MASRTVRVRNISDLAGEREIREFFSFGEIGHVDIAFNDGGRRVAFVTFKDAQAFEIALLLSGATIVDQVVSITCAENYIYIPVAEKQIVLNEVACASTDSTGNHISTSENTTSPSDEQASATKAHEVVRNMLARGSAIRQDAVNRAKAFDERHQLRANASAKLISFDRRVGLSEKMNMGISVVNEKVKSVDQRLHVSDKTMAALFVAEQKLNGTGTAVKTNRYVTAGTSWLNGAFTKVAKVGQVAGTKTRERFQLAVSNLTAKDPVAAT